LRKYQETIEFHKKEIKIDHGFNDDVMKAYKEARQRNR
jgi:hypothetical protein